MLGWLRNPDHPPNQPQKQRKQVFSVSFRPENFVPGLVIGFILGFLWDLSQSNRDVAPTKNFSAGKSPKQYQPGNDNHELKMVLVVRQDLKMKNGKLASQCAHAATGMYAELLQSNRSLLKQWEQCGQPKIVVTCRNQQEMSKLKEAAEGIGLPTFVVADAGRTQVAAGSKTVLAVGPGPKASIDTVTGRLPLL